MTTRSTNSLRPLDALVSDCDEMMMSIVVHEYRSVLGFHDRVTGLRPSLILHWDFYRQGLLQAHLAIEDPCPLSYS